MGVPRLCLATGRPRSQFGLPYLQPGPATRACGAYAGVVEGASVGHAGRGRLDLDGMGDDGADLVSLEAGDEVGPEVLEGPQGVTWGERLESAGVTAYLRRHRVVARSVLVVLAVVGLVAGGVTAYRSTRPPADDGVIAVTVWETTSTSGETTTLTEQGTLELSYFLSPQRPGDSLRLLGLDGPGVRASAGSEPVTPVAGKMGDHDLAVIPDCDDPTVLAAQDGDYHLRVQRTDALGRTVTGLVAVPVGSSVHWPVLIGQACAPQWLDESITTEAVDVSTTHPTTGVPALDLVPHLHNEFGHDIAIYGGGSNYEVGGALLVAGTTTLLSVSVPVPDCRSPVEALDRGVANGLELIGTVETPGNRGDGEGIIGGRFTVRWSAPVAHRIDTALRALCKGVPQVTVDVVSVSPATDIASTAPLQNPGPVVAVLRTQLLVTSAATRVTVSDTATPADIAQGSRVYFTTATADLRRGVAEVSVDWATTCDPQPGPPIVQLVLTSGQHRYPEQVTLADATLTAAFLRTCGLIYTADLANAGWPPIPG